MPNNITHLPTDETLESGLSLIAQALDGDKISQISAKLSSQSKSLSEIDSFLADNLSGINTKLVAKGSTAASLYSDIPGKIEDIETSSTPFRLIPANVTVENGSFSLEYEGTPPNVNTASIIETVEGTNQTGLSYSVAYSNGTATFTLVGTADGVVSAQTNAVVKIGDTGVVIGATGLPVKYEPRIVSIDDVVVTDRTDVMYEEIHIVPTGVSPKADLNTGVAIGTVFSNNGLYFSDLELEVYQELPQYPEDYTLIIPSDTFDSTVEDGYMFVSTEPASGTGGQTFKVGLTFED